jgi:hypothetical protein
VTSLLSFSLAALKLLPDLPVLLLGNIMSYNATSECQWHAVGKYRYRQTFLSNVAAGAYNVYREPYEFTEKGMRLEIITPHFTLSYKI